MKAFLTTAFLAAALAAPIARADDAHHPEDPATQAPRSASAPRVDEKSAKQMQDHMARMQELMTKVQKATDPAQRQKLLDEHRQAMREGMAMMRGMGGGMMRGMMSGGQAGRAPKDGAGKGATPRPGPMAHHDMMEMRMDMMQIMMEHMMQHDQMLHGMPVK